MLPSQEVLAQRLFDLSQELADTQRHLQRYHALVVALRDRMRELAAEAGGGDDPRLLELQRQLNDGWRGPWPPNRRQAQRHGRHARLVSAQVTLRPSGHQFVVEGRDSPLQAGLRAGLQAQLRLRQRQLRRNARCASPRARWRA